MVANGTGAGGAGVPGRIRTSTTGGLGAVPPTWLGYEDLRASDRIRPGDLLRTKETLFRLSYRGTDVSKRVASPTRGPAEERTALLPARAAYGAATPSPRACLAGRSGFEPEPGGPEPPVLPGYTISHRNCMYAARGSNSVPGLKRPVHHPSCLRRGEGECGVAGRIRPWSQGRLWS